MAMQILEKGLGSSVSMFRLEANRGKGGVIRAGFEHALGTVTKEPIDFTARIVERGGQFESLSDLGTLL